MGVISFRHSGNLGDLCAAMACIRKAWVDSGKKAILYCRLNVDAKYYEGAQRHTMLDMNGKEVMLNQQGYEMFRPLALDQEYIEDVRIWDGCVVDVDLDEIRVKYTGQPNLSLLHWYGFIFHDLHVDISKQWLYVDAKAKKHKRIIVNRTSRYHNQYISYFFLKKYEADTVFVGVREEYEGFCKEWNLDIPHYKVNDFLELAKVIKESALFLGNQSFVYNVCEGMKVPRVLELCNWAANCIVSGKDAYGFLHQTACEYYCDLLFNKA